MFSDKKNKKVLVAMSGGVDSSVAALLLKKQGFDVAGGFIRGYNVDGCQDKDAEDARLVCEKIGIPFYVFNFEDEYKNKVVDYLLEGYKRGITPNPDVVCNREIKFGLLYDAAVKMGFDSVASGHYVRVKRLGFRGKRGIGIFEGKDKNKDQSYFLWDVPEKKFEHLIFPLGKIRKPEVRKIAKKADLPVAEKKDSQGVCFLGKFDFGDFLRERISTKTGDIVDTNGNKVGEHDGVWLYTIGQKHGFKNFSGVQFYVIGKDLENNRLIVDFEESDKLYCKRFELTDLNFLDDNFKSDFESGKLLKILIRTRYRQPLFLADIILIKNPNKSAPQSALISLKKPMKIFPASGQSTVFYSRSGQMLGGGVII